MERSKIDSRYKWNLNDIIDGEEAWEREYAVTLKKTDGIKAYSGKLSLSDAALLCFKLDEEISLSVFRLYAYAKMNQDSDGRVAKYDELVSRALSLSVDYSAKSSFIVPELTELGSEYLESLARRDGFYPYSRFLADVARRKKHILSTAEERILALSGEIGEGFHEIFSKIDNVDLAFSTVTTPDGKKMRLTHANYAVALQSRDKSFRRRAFKAYYRSYKKQLTTIATVYGSSIKKDVFYTRARKFDSCLDRALFSEEVDPKVYATLVDSATRNVGSLHRYVALRKRITGIKDFSMSDLHFPLFEGVELSCEFDEAYETVLKALEPLGEDYVELLKKAKDERWIDVFENNGKRSGAYSFGVYGVHPYVLLNYEKTTSAVFTIAHEMGHAMHSYYSDHALPMALADYRIFVAEVASTVNEVLLLKYLLGKAKDVKTKKYLISYFLDMFRTTFFRQTQFAEFEKLSHELCENGGAPSEQVLSAKYLELNKKYYGSAVKHDPEIAFEWARIPHFYTAYYVYKYATGIAAAVRIADGIYSGKEGAVKSYRKFLESGNTADPVSLLKIAGVSLDDESTFTSAIAEFDGYVETLGKLCDESEQ